MHADFKHPPFDSAAALEGFSPYSKAASSAKAAADMIALLLNAFDALDQRLAPIFSLADTMGGFGLTLGNLLAESPEMRETVEGARRSDSEIQSMSAKGFAKALVAIDHCLAEDGADGDLAAKLLSDFRGACIASLPERCRAPWAEYVHHVEVAFAAHARGEPLSKGAPPRL